MLAKSLVHATCVLYTVATEFYSNDAVFCFVLRLWTKQDYAFFDILVGVEKGVWR